MSREEIAQELECNFNASGETVIHGDDLKLIWRVSSNLRDAQDLIETIGSGTTHRKLRLLIGCRCRQR